MKDSEDKYINIAKQAWLHFSDLEIAEINKIPEGFKNKSYYIKDTSDNKFVLKIYAQNFLNDFVISEYSKILANLYANNVQVIEMIKGKDGNFLQIVNINEDRFQITMSKFVELSEFSEKYLNKTIVEEIASCLANLHNKLVTIEMPKDVRQFKPIDTLKDLLSEKTLNQIREYFLADNIHRPERLNKYLETYVKDGTKILEYFENSKTILDNTQLIHGDFNLSNLNIQNNKIITIFDFDEMTLAPITFEIGCSLVHLDEGFMFTDDLIELYINKYMEFNKLNVKDIEDILMFMQYRAFYRISRWFTYYRFSTNNVEHFSKYQQKLDRYKQLNTSEIINFISQ